MSDVVSKSFLMPTQLMLVLTTRDNKRIANCKKIQDKIILITFFHAV